MTDMATDLSTDRDVDDESGREFVRALARGLQIIECFEDSRSPMTLSEVARATGLSRGTTARLLKTLEALHYVRSHGRHFLLQPRVLRLGYAYLSSQPLWQVAQPMLEAVANETGAICSLAVMDQIEIVYVSWMSSTRVSWDFVGAGGRLPLFCSSMGRALLSGLSDTEVEAIIARSPLEKRTPRTIVDPQRLLEIVGQARANGYATQDEEITLGQLALAVPVRDRLGATVASLNVTSYSHRHTVEGLCETMLPVLRREAHKLGDAVSFMPRFDSRGG